MTITRSTVSRWHTAALGGSPDTSPMDLLTLQEHLGVCQALRGRLFDLRCGSEAVYSFLAARIVTTLILLVSLTVLGLAWA